MPLYDYQCRTCSKVTEVRHGFREPYDAPCPACGGELARVFNPAGIVFKGSGFYITDSRKSESSGSKGEGSGSGEAGKSGESAKSTEPAKSSEPASKPSETTTKKSESSAA